MAEVSLSNCISYSSVTMCIGVGQITSLFQHRTCNTYQVETFTVSKTRTSARVSKMIAVARTQSSQHFMLTLLQKYLYHQSQYLKTWDSKCLSLIYQMVGAFGINWKVGGSSPPQVETFSVSKTFTITSVRASKTNVVDRAQLTWQMLSLVEKI